MALFRRKPTTEIPELQEYYATTRRDNPIMAWLLAALSLIVTIAVVLGLFFGGRWAYRTVFDNDKPTNVAQNNDQNQNPGSSEQPQGSTDTDQQPEATNTPSTPAPSTPSPTPAPQPQSGTSTTQTQSGQSSSSSSSAGSTTTTPTTGASSEALPNTGPGDIVAIFVVTVLVGYLASNRYFARKN